MARDGGRDLLEEQALCRRLISSWRWNRPAAVALSVGESEESKDLEVPCRSGGWWSENFGWLHRERRLTKDYKRKAHAQ